jgi:hypothetical protein
MRHRQACDHCGGRFGMVTCRWWGNKFCKRTCKDAYRREVALGRDKILCWYGFLRRGIVSNFSLCRTITCETSSPHGYRSL